MWPWGHLAVAYLLYTLYTRVRFRRSPSDGAAFLVALGSQFPDLVDKPLAWGLGVLPAGRSLAHSLVLAVPLVVLAALVARRADRDDLCVAFGVGYLSHLATDALPLVVARKFVYLSFLGWPALPAPTYGDEGGFLVHVTTFEPTAFSAAEFGAVVLVFGVWWADGFPGVPAVRERLCGRWGRSERR